MVAEGILIEGILIEVSVVDDVPRGLVEGIFVSVIGVESITVLPAP